MNFYCLCFFAVTLGLPGSDANLRGSKRTLSENNVNHVNFVIFQPDDLNFVWPERPDAADTTRHLTPHIDVLRSEGAVFTRGYSAGSMCAPSRVALMTGRYPSRSKSARQAAVSADSCVNSNDEFANIAGRAVPVTVHYSKLDQSDKINNLQTTLQDKGYSTFMVGKWHLASAGSGVGKGDAEWLPQETAYPAAVAATKATGWTDVGGLYISNFGSGLGFSHNLEWVTASAVGFIEQAHDSGKPFFLYMNPTAPHSPDVSDAMKLDLTKTPAGDVDNPFAKSGMPTRAQMRRQSKRQPIGDGDQTALGVTWVDESLGAVYTKLKALNILDNTMFVFVMDHGNAGKGDLTEAGVRIAYNIRYPGHPVFTAGKYYADLVSNMDLAPTVLELATGSHDHGYETDGHSLLSIDPDTSSDIFGIDNGLSFVPESSSISWQQDRAIFVENDHDRAIVTRRYKYVAHSIQTCDGDNQESSQTGVSLYDLHLDPTESVDRAGRSSYSEVEARLRKLMQCHLTDTNVGGNGPSSACIQQLSRSRDLPS